MNYKLSILGRILVGPNSSEEMWPLQGKRPKRLQPSFPLNPDAGLDGLVPSTEPSNSLKVGHFLWLDLARSTWLISAGSCSTLHFSAAGWPIKPLPERNGKGQPWCMWCLWWSSSLPCSQPAGAPPILGDQCYQVGQTYLLEQPLQDYEREAKNKATSDMENKNASPKQHRKKKNKKEVTYGPIYWSKLLKKGFKRSLAAHEKRTKTHSLVVTVGDRWS